MLPACTRHLGRLRCSQLFDTVQSRRTYESDCAMHSDGSTNSSVDDWSQYVATGSARSETSALSSGVARGSILDPLLFRPTLCACVRATRLFSRTRFSASLSSAGLTPMTCYCCSLHSYRLRSSVTECISIHLLAAESRQKLRQSSSGRGSVWIAYLLTSQAPFFVESVCTDGKISKLVKPNHFCDTVQNVVAADAASTSLQTVMHKLTNSH